MKLLPFSCRKSIDYAPDTKRTRIELCVSHYFHRALGDTASRISKSNTTHIKLRNELSRILFFCFSYGDFYAYKVHK